MVTRITTVVLLGLSVAAGCAPPASQASSSVASTITTASVVAEVPAVDRQRFPDSIGYLYEGSLATVFWMQNDPVVARLEDLEQRLARNMERGLSGEFLTTAMQHVEPTSSSQPTLPQITRRAVQSVRLLAQYAVVSQDYGASLAGALSAYNSDATRKQAVADASARVEAALTGLVESNPATTLPAAPPPLDRGTIRPGRHFAAAVKAAEQTFLLKRARDMQRAITARNATAYASAFTDVYYVLRDAALAKAALEALAEHHEDGVLEGLPLDVVIADHVLRSRDPEHPLSTEQLSLINRINLISGNTGVSKHALVAALLLLAEDHKQGQQDGTLSAPVIWSHVGDTTWLVSQYIRLKADGTTAAQVHALLDSIVASI